MRSALIGILHNKASISFPAAKRNSKRGNWVAAGMPVARPSPRTDRCGRYELIRLLPWMSGVEACVGKGAECRARATSGQNGAAVGPS
jgi:hypothetical protein